MELSFEQHTKTDRLYNTYHSIKQRCFNESNPRYNDYGGRGISVCLEWLESFNVFKAWALEHGYADGLQIDRINNDKDYEPDNCRWVTLKENCNNKGKQNHWLEWEGQRVTMKQLSELTGINYSTLRSRLNKQKLTVEQAVYDRSK